MNFELQDEMKDSLEHLVNVCISDLEKIRKQDDNPKEAVKNVAKRLLGRNVPEKRIAFWPAGMLLLGLNEVLSNEGDNHKVSSYLELYFNTWLSLGVKIQHIDDAVAGLVLLDYYDKVKAEKYLALVKEMTFFLETYERDEGNCIVYNARAGNQFIFADGTGQTAAYLTKAGHYFGREDLIRLGVTQLLEFYKHGMDKSTGLPYHAFSRKRNQKLGIVGWGRATGWLCLGYGEALQHIADDPEAEKVRNQFRELIRITEKYQRADGGFSWMLQATEGEPDTSATAMIGYGILQGIRAGLLEKEQYMEMLYRMAGFLLKNTIVGSVGQCLGDCVDLAMHPQVFGHFPCGQGATLAFFEDLLKVYEKE